MMCAIKMRPSGATPLSFCMMKKYAQVPAATAAFCYCKNHAGNVAKSQIESLQKAV
jgi:hypothetical protein